MVENSNLPIAYHIVKDGGIDVHQRVGNIRDIHRRYGLCILNGAVYTAPADGFYTTAPRKFEFYSLSHLIGGRGRLFLAPDYETDVVQGDAILICPGDVNRYGGYGGESYTEEVLVFCGPVADMLREAGVLRSGVYRIGNSRPLQPLIALARDPADAAQINANITLQALLVELYNKKRAANTHNPLEELIAAIKKAPERWWTVGEMAAMCNLSINQMRRNFQKHTGMLPKEYVEHIKLRRAAEILVADHKAPIAHVAAALGYFDEYHFSRRFKIFFKVPPGKYRNLVVR